MLQTPPGPLQGSKNKKMVLLQLQEFAKTILCTITSEPFFGGDLACAFSVAMV